MKEMTAEIKERRHAVLEAVRDGKYKQAYIVLTAREENT